MRRQKIAQMHKPKQYTLHANWLRIQKSRSLSGFIGTNPIVRRAGFQSVIAIGMDIDTRLGRGIGVMPYISPALPAAM